MRKRADDPEGYPKAMLLSALMDDGLQTAWAEMQTLMDWRRANGRWQKNREAQARHWFEKECGWDYWRKWAKAKWVMKLHG